MKFSLSKMMPPTLLRKATAGESEARQAPASDTSRDAKTKKRGVLGKLRDMCSRRKSADAAPATLPTQITAAAEAQPQSPQTAVPPTSRQFCTETVACKPASSPAAVQPDAQLTQQAAQAVAAKAAQVLTCRAQQQKQTAQSETAPTASSPAAAVPQPAEQLGRVDRMVLAERIAQMMRAQQAQFDGSSSDDSASGAQQAASPSQPRQRTSSCRTSSSSSDLSVELQQPAQRPPQLMQQEDYESFSPIVQRGDGAHLQLINISRSLMTHSSPFEHDPKMLAWEIAAVKAGSFRWAPPMPSKK